MEEKTSKSLVVKNKEKTKESLEEKIEDFKDENIGPLLKKVGIGLGIYWSVCAGAKYLIDHHEIYKPIIDYFRN